MPGRVDANVTYSVFNSTWNIKMVATASAKTRMAPPFLPFVGVAEHSQPLALMLTQHTYFNLDAYKNPSTALIWDHLLSLPYSKRYLAIDSSALPTGKIVEAAAGSINDFWSKSDFTLGHAKSVSGFRGNCGGSCEGYNGFWLIEGAKKDDVVLRLGSQYSGVKAELKTDQVGVVL
jgi:galactose mutarotase-like enzyme